MMMAPLLMQGLMGCSDPARNVHMEVEVKVQEAVNLYRAGDAQASTMAWKEAMSRFRDYTWDAASNRPLDQRLQEKSGDLTLAEWRGEWEKRLSATAAERWDTLLTAVEEGRLSVEDVETLWLPLDRNNRLKELWAPYRAELPPPTRPDAQPLTPEQVQEQERALARQAIRLNCIIRDLPGEQDQIIDQLLCATVAEALQSKTGERDLIPESTAPESDFHGVIQAQGALTWQDYPDHGPGYRIPKGIHLEIHAQRQGKTIPWNTPAMTASLAPPPTLPDHLDWQAFLSQRNAHVERLATVLEPKLNALPSMPP